MEAVILAGGFGTRLESISQGIPKPLMPINGRPFLLLLLERLKSQGIEHVVLSLHYKPELFFELQDATNPNLPRLSFSIESEPLGTGGGAKLAAKSIEGSDFFILNGDTYCPFNMDRFPRRAESTEVLILAAWVEDVSRYGSLSLDATDSVLSFNEKEQSGAGFINAGTYFLNKDLLLSYEKEIFSLEADFFDLNQLCIKAVRTNEIFIDIGIPSDYYTAASLLA